MKILPDVKAEKKIYEIQIYEVQNLVNQCSIYILTICTTFLTVGSLFSIV